MKHIYFIILFLSFGALQAQSLEKVRTAYTTASDSKENAVAFVELMANAPTTDVVLSAYKGASKMILAKYGSNRIALLKEGKPLLENALKQRPQNAELHLIRLSVQEHLPKVVPYRKDITADKDFILAHYAQQTRELQKYIAGFVKKSKVFNDGEKKKLNLQ
ncbi:Uncharacterised protein [Capnocytophaga ochracea]|uniref:DUF4142 domain-containing protein n=1 Tax=Capnocytophaga ochracea TaxID=1018 RepID=A0A2X2RBK4_CAPOC|nr:hypothetical protein [Capnocytophaga ochracea]SQA77772.1 Uncharacterised protein [Capnocytophaga ochracea]